MLLIFNPEHDLCLANGNRNFVPPMSALRFADQAASLMQYVYPGTECYSVGQIAALAMRDTPGAIVPWGWNIALKTALIKQGIAESLMPSDATLELWRQLQHRSTVLPLQPYCSAVTTLEEVETMLSRYHAVVLKAPWSGSGRGIRWVTGALSQHDALWLQKVVREQRCVIVEPRWQVQDTYALEYRVSNHQLQFVGYSLFESSSGVYQCNLLLPDEEIAMRVGLPEAQRDELETWLQSAIEPYYEGPLGVDYILSPDGSHHLTELNLRHTMGLVAHEYLRQHPAAAGGTFSPLSWHGG